MIEKLILSGLVQDEVYMRRVIPFLKDEYFSDPTDKVLFSTITKYIDRYNGLPTKEALKIELDENPYLNEDGYKQATLLSSELYSTEIQDIEWMSTKTEEFCQDKAIFNAVRESIKILDGGDAKLDRGAIPTLLADALAVSFDTNIGHDFLENSEDRYHFYHRKEEKIPFDLDYFNMITNNGLSRKSLGIVMGGTGGGKTLLMCHHAAASLMFGYNVLYITMEMAEERIAERIDANLFDMPVDSVALMPPEAYEKRISRLRRTTKGKLIIKEYPTASANANHFRYLLRELKLKKNFVPDIIFVDYINICASSRMKMGGSINSYTYIKAIAEELRGLAIEFNVAMMSATQTNRSGFTSSDPGLEDTSECIFSEEKVQLRDGTIKKIKDIVVGDQIKSQDDYKTVMMTHHPKIKKCYRITTKSGKSITVSEDHVFPTNRGRISIKKGLKKGDKLNTK